MVEIRTYLREHVGVPGPASANSLSSPQGLNHTFNFIVVSISSVHYAKSLTCNIAQTTRAAEFTKNIIQNIHWNTNRKERNQTQDACRLPSPHPPTQDPDIVQRSIEGICIKHTIVCTRDKNNRIGSGYNHFNRSFSELAAIRQLFSVDSFAPLILPVDISMKITSRKVRIQCLRVREWGGFHRNATSFLAAVIPASSNRLVALNNPSLDKLFSSRTGIVTGIVTDVKFESWEATLVQNCSTGGHSHIMWIKVTGEFRFQRLQDRSFINFIACSLRGVK